MRRSLAASPLAALLVVGGALGACARHIARPPVEEVPMRDPSETPGAPLVPRAASAAADKSASLVDRGDKPDKPEKSDKAADAAAPTAAPMFSLTADDAEPPRDRAFPRQTDACKRDDDCAITTLALGGDMMCCASCRPTAGTKGWVRRVEQVCAQKVRAGLKPRCAPFDCSRVDAECRAGKCSVKTAPP